MKRIRFYGIIGKDITDSSFIDSLPKNGEDLELRVNSPGGNVFQGFAIYNALKNYKGKKKIHIDGVAASMSSLVVLAGDEIVIAENAMIMIHNPAVSAEGDSRELRKSAELLDKVKGIMLDGYQSRTNIEKSVLATMLDNETWFDAKEALENGFVNSIDTPVLEQGKRPTSHDTLEIFASYKMPFNKHSIISALELSANAQEHNILTAIQNLKDKAKEKEPSQEQKDEAKKLVRKACYDKKIKADLIEYYEVLAIADYDAVSEIFNKTPVLIAGSEFINHNFQNSEDRSNWTLEDYRRKDPNALKDKTLFENLLNTK